jgi:hypothetical protein
MWLLPQIPRRQAHQSSSTPNLLFQTLFVVASQCYLSRNVIGGTSRNGVLCTLALCVRSEFEGS